MNATIRKLYHHLSTTPEKLEIMIFYSTFHACLFTIILFSLPPLLQKPFEQGNLTEMNFITEKLIFYFFVSEIVRILKSKKKITIDDLNLVIHIIILDKRVGGAL